MLVITNNPFTTANHTAIPKRKRFKITHVKVLRTENISRRVQTWNGKYKIQILNQEVPEGSEDKPYRSAEVIASVVSY